MFGKNKLNKLVLVSLCFAGSVMAEETVWDKAHNAIDKTKEIVTETKEKVEAVTEDGLKFADKFVDDSTITAKVKKAIAEERLASGYEISVTTKEGIVTLTGFVPSVELQLKAVHSAEAIEGVRMVSDKLIVREDNPLTVKGYFSDSAITSEIKSKLVMQKNLSAIDISVETVDGIVQLSGTVKTKEESVLAEMTAKAVQGVKTVKNDLEVIGVTFATEKPKEEQPKEEAKEEVKEGKPAE